MDKRVFSKRFHRLGHKDEAPQSRSVLQSKAGDNTSLGLGSRRCKRISMKFRLTQETRTQSVNSLSVEVAGALRCGRHLRTKKAGDFVN